MKLVKNIQESAKEYTEIKLRRTSHSKTYHINNKTYRTYQTISPIHYEDTNNELRSIDLTPVDKGDHWLVEKAPYTLKLYKDTLNVDYTSDKGGRTKISLKKIGNLPVGILPITPIIDDDGITFKNVQPDLDLQLRIKPQGIEWYKILHNSSVATKFEWEVLEDKDATFGHRETPIGNDADKNRIELINTKVQMPDVDGMNCYKMVEEFTGRIKKIVDKKTRVKKWSTDVVYPVTIDVPDVTESTVGADDGHNNTKASEYIYWGSPFLTPTTPAVAASSSNMGGTYDIYWGRRGFATHNHQVNNAPGHWYRVDITRTNPVFRFTTVAVPWASTITLAELKVYVWTVQGAGLAGGGTVLGIDEDNVAVQAAGNKWASKAKTTANTTSGTINTTGLKTLEVTSIVQEIIDRTGWTNNNAMGMFLSGNDPAQQIPFMTAAATGDPTKAASGVDMIGLDTTEAAGTNQAVLEITFDLPNSSAQIRFIGA